MPKAIVFDAYGTLFDTQSVGALIEDAFPGRGSYITQVWRLKQLEYSWLGTLMGREEDFWTLTREALAYTLGTLGQAADERLLETLAQAYNRLEPYPEAGGALAALAPRRLAILSNGSEEMLGALVAHSGFGPHFEAVISVEDARAFKPDPRAYGLVEDRLGLRPEEVAFVSSNGFDVAGARRFGFRVVRVARLSPKALARDLATEPTIDPSAMFKALRSQEERCGPGADVSVRSLAELPGALERLDGA